MSSLDLTKGKQTLLTKGNKLTTSADERQTIYQPSVNKINHLGNKLLHDIRKTFLSSKSVNNFTRPDHISEPKTHPKIEPSLFYYNIPLRKKVSKRREADRKHKGHTSGLKHSLRQIKHSRANKPVRLKPRSHSAFSTPKQHRSANKHGCALV